MSRWAGLDHICVMWRTKDIDVNSWKKISCFPLDWWWPIGLLAGLTLLVATGHCKVSLCLRIMPISSFMPPRQGCCPLPFFPYFDYFFDKNFSPLESNRKRNGLYNVLYFQMFSFLYVKLTIFLSVFYDQIYHCQFQSPDPI